MVDNKSDRVVDGVVSYFELMIGCFDFGREVG